ncbi:MAG: gamma-glutamyltransferase [Polyangiaceae bacterium]
MRVRPTTCFFSLLVLVGCGAANPPPAKPVSADPHTTSVATTPVVFPPAWPYPAGKGGAEGAHGMVSSDATLASKVAQEVLASGGNAVDASVALAFALAVVHPAAGNVGGGGFMVARMAGKPYALDFRETAPARATRDVYIGADGKATAGSKDGHRASGVPGSVAGLHEAHQKLGSGKKSWKELVAPAIKLAKEGFVVDENFSKVIDDLKGRLAKNPTSAALFLPNGAPPVIGTTWKDPELAAVLERIAAEGPKGFYEGPTADLLDAEMKANDGLLTKEDLKAYRAKWRTPVEFDYRGHHVISMPPPSSGGVSLAMMAHILEKIDLPSMAWHSPTELHFVFEAMRRSFAARNARLGDPDFVKNPLDELLAPAWADKARSTILPDKATPSSEIPSAEASGTGPHTTHFSVVDSEGNAVALTTTINWWFGSGVTVKGAGFVMNNEMDDFASKPGTENGFGLVQGEPNAVAPGKRMLSSMSPTIVVDQNGKVELVLGAAGGPRIITAVFQILSNVVDHRLDVVSAVNAPRFHHQHLPDVVLHEKDGITDLQKAELERMGYKLEERGHLADAPTIGRGPSGYVGVPEPRRAGSHAAGW